jgi:type VI secretion system protein ImpA
MVADVEALLAPVSEEQPCGPDLSRASERSELERLIASATTVEFDGNTGQPKPLPEIDWKPVIRRIVEQLGKTKDISLAVYLCRAGALGKQLDVVAQGTAVLNGLLERYWDTVHPRLDDLELVGRSTLCESLAHRGLFLAPLERVPVLAHPRLGVFKGSDLNRLRKNAEADAEFGPFKLALNELGDQPIRTAYALLGEIDDGLRQAAGAFAAKAGGQASLNFKPTHATIGELRKALSFFFIASPADAQAEPETSAAESADSGAPRGALNGREDVLRALDAVAEYYRRREPSSPVLPMVERAKAWVPMSFMDVLEDIAPESLTAVKLVLSKRPRS